MNLEKWIELWNELKEKPQVKVLLRVLKMLFLLGVIAFILYQLSQIGIANVIDNLPLNPAFYVLFFVLYFSLPFWEIIIYKLFWKFRFKSGFRPFITKKILNTEVVGYSGEVYLFAWAKKKFKLPNKDIYGPIKDNSILSSVASTVTAIVLLVVYSYSTDVEFLQAVKLSEQSLYLIIGVVVVVLSALFFFRHKVLSIKSDKIWKVLMLHEIRILASYMIEMFQWSIIMPEVPFTVWFTFLAVKIITSRLPFIPNQDIIFASLGIELGRALNVSSAGIAGILLTNSALNKITNLVCYTFFQVKKELKKSK